MDGLISPANTGEKICYLDWIIVGPTKWPKNRDVNRSVSVPNLLVSILEPFTEPGSTTGFGSNSKLVLWLQFRIWKKLNDRISVLQPVSISVSMIISKPIL